MNSRFLLFLLPLACAAPMAASAQTPPKLTYALTGSGSTTVLGQAADYRNYTFNITGFSDVGPDLENAYTIFSISNTSIEKSPDVYGVAGYDLPEGWTFSDVPDFIISTDAQGIHATDPTFGLVIFQKAGTPAPDIANAPFTLYHEDGGVDPFKDPIYASTPVPEASSVISLSVLLALGVGGVWARRRLGTSRH